MGFNDDEEPPTTARGRTKGLVTIKPAKYFKEDAALTADIVTAELEINATSSTVVREGLDLVAVLDLSGRMYGKKMEYMRRAMVFVIMKLTPVDRLSIVTFSDAATRPCPLRSMSRDAQDDLKSLVNGLLQQANGGPPNIKKGLEMGLAVMADRVHTVARTANIFLLSDGHQATGDARQVDPGHVAIYTFGFGRGTSHRLLSDIAEKSPFGTYCSAHHRSVWQLLAGLLSVVAQDVQLTITPKSGYDEWEEEDLDAIEVASGTDYTVIRDAATGMITINFGRLSAGESRRVFITLTLRDVSATCVDEYDAPLAEAQHIFTTQARPRDPQVPQDIQIRRTGTPSPDITRWEHEAAEIDKDVVVNKAQDDDGQIVLNRLRAELEQLTTRVHRGSDDTYLEQAMNFDKAPQRRRPLPMRV
ncbi:unnamed protein product [Urochloa humidicola]